ncbi:malonyl-coenzyme A:anthocyanin 3-O-glucoside-6''-O-malonyltransferase-like protein [Cinnamomum micranthum f. kanehirae]|uniref:Malonyl-coenzyme A:anthocyanin 3-O-glucoside-6''-O-malonyltransferase-like protein n=1 Tax=Cinnamomum micranthum f. kanehirae TaxID=337451 RepID=A0A3S3P4C8_9MAGN|nr:malonyl-coenzyme A:anthocyanin 3-O-glucoside-6''-O-malonyltransferase-like protein [Cinnamomum micranthum f. kanehirae]
MGETNMVKVLELSKVSPPPGSVAETYLPLTFFDVSWLQLPSVQRIFLYEFSDPNTTTTSHFLHSLLPNLKHSLSLALQLFYPLCGNLTLSPQTGFPDIHYIDGDSVSFSAVESAADFHHLVSNYPKDPAEFHTLVPSLPNSTALLSLQVTLFPNSGICIGFCLHHAAADGRSVNHFMKSWSTINRTGDMSLIAAVPIYDRDLVKDPNGLKRLFMDQMEEYMLWKNVEQMAVPKVEKPLRATFVLTRSDIERLKQRAMARPDSAEKPLRCSTFAAACGYVWVCLIKARGYVEDKTVYFTAPVDCRTRLYPPIPNAYFGNCITGATAKAPGRDLAGKDGLATASEAIGRAVEGLREGVLKGAENWIPYFASIANEHIVSVAGSPRFRVYDTDFGWGRPRKTEVVSIDGTGAVYIGDSRDEEGGIEFGLLLPTSEIGAFSSLFEEGLKSGY